MKKLLVVFILFCAGCSDVDVTIRDQCMRRQIFKECLAALPVGPTTVVSNDWSEVVDSCESAAAYQSLRRTSQVKVECRP